MSRAVCGGPPSAPAAKVLGTSLVFEVSEMDAGGLCWRRMLEGKSEGVFAVFALHDVGGLLLGQI